MTGCLKRLGCLFFAFMFLALVVAGWFGRDVWMARVPFTPVARRQAAAHWERPSPQGAQRADSALKQLLRKGGPAYVNVAPGDLIAFILKEFVRSLPSSTDSIEAAVVGEQLHVRARVKTSDLGGQAVLGPLAWLVSSERERVEFGGTLHVIKPGLTEYQVKTFRVRDVGLPQSLIPALVRQITQGARAPELAPDGLPLATPAYIGDVRVANGRVTVYRKP